MADSRTSDSGAVAPARIVDDAEALDWDTSADVVVVGFGGAGVVAAISAREGGASVVALDRFGGGGATRWSGGVIYAGGGTAQQAAAGFEDDVENMYAYLSQEKSVVRDETLRRFCAASPETLSWLEQQGVEFEGLFGEAMAYPPDGTYLYYSGNERAPTYAQRARPVPRGHRTVGKGFTGRTYFAKLRESAEAKGVQIIPHAPVRRLIADRGGRVIGVEIVDIPRAEHERHQAFDTKINPMSPLTAGHAERTVAAARAFEERFAGRKLVRARSGVILSTGGFVYNLDKIKEVRPDYAAIHKSAMRLGSLGCDGSGIALGQSMGGDVGHLGKLFVGRSLAPPKAMFRGTLVNTRGERFINEDTYAAFLGEAIADQPGGKAWLILDHDTFKQARRQMLRPPKGLVQETIPAILNTLFGGTKKAKTLAELASKIGVDAEGLARTAAAVTQAARAGADDLGKAPQNISPLQQGPFHAINMGLANRFALTLMFTLGGLEVDEDTGNVLRADGSHVPGLFAAGRAAVGLVTGADISGLTLADTIFSGRRAGKHAAIVRGAD